MAERGTQRLFGLGVAAAAVMMLPGTAGAQEAQRSDTAANQADETGAARMDTSGQDTARWGYETNRDPAAQNPPGYRGMERPADLDSATAEQQEIEEYTRRLGELGYKVEKMTRAEKKAWKQAKQRKGGDGTREQSGTGRDTVRVGETTPKVPEDSARRLPAERGDTTGQDDER